jgi:hypothetical protein
MFIIPKSFQKLEGISIYCFGRPDSYRDNTLSVISFLPFTMWQLAKKDATSIVNAS